MAAGHRAVYNLVSRGGASPAASTRAVGAAGEWRGFLHLPTLEPGALSHAALRACGPPCRRGRGHGRSVSPSPYRVHESIRIVETPHTHWYPNACASPKPFRPPRARTLAPLLELFVRPYGTYRRCARSTGSRATDDPHAPHERRAPPTSSMNGGGGYIRRET